MGTMNASSFQISSGASNYDEVSMHQSLQFSDCLKYLHGGYSVTEMDGESSCWINYLRSESFQGFTSSQDLKNLRTQLYSAAEYFELSYSNDDQKQIVVETLRDYAIKALVNTVDHLGSVTYKVNDLLDEKVDEVSGMEYQVSFIEQRLRTCRDFMDREGLSQQSLMINTPKFHKRYILRGEAVNGSDGTKIKYGCCLDDEDDWQQFKNAIRMTIRDSPASNSVQGTRDGLPSPSPRPPSQGSETFHFTFTTSRKELDKRTVSPNRSPLVRTGSLASREVTPKTSRPTTPNLIWHPAPSFSFPGGQQYPLEPWISSSMRLLAGREKRTETEHPSKSKRLLKALLSRRKSKKDETLYTYLDEY